jgi:hypothetical protein
MQYRGLYYITQWISDSGKYSQLGASGGWTQALELGSLDDSSTSYATALVI